MTRALADSFHQLFRGHRQLLANDIDTLAGLLPPRQAVWSTQGGIGPALLASLPYPRTLNRIKRKPEQAGSRDVQRLRHVVTLHVVPVQMTLHSLRVEVLSVLTRLLGPAGRPPIGLRASNNLVPPVVPDAARGILQQHLGRCLPDLEGHGDKDCDARRDKPQQEHLPYSPGGAKIYMLGAEGIELDIHLIEKPAKTPAQDANDHEDDVVFHTEDLVTPRSSGDLILGGVVAEPTGHCDHDLKSCNAPCKYFP
mmetsp:Transcript_78422/g.209548  ORF Transcript_78422/g.209548 Transcript_78422/m.209548 type:complete len:253 (-) Transcript_78422:904-1662(-)